MSEGMDARARGARMLRESGYKRAKGGGIHDDAAADAEMVGAGVHEHEANMHKGWPKTKMKLRRGGEAAGKEPKHRPDRRARGGLIGEEPNDDQGNVHAASNRAKGGHVGKHKGKVTININDGAKGDPAREQMAHQQGMQQGAAMASRAAPAVPPRPPMPPPGGPMGAAPGGPPGMPPGGGGMPPPHPMMPPPGAGPGGPPPGAMPPRPPGMMSRGGAMRDARGRFTGGAV